MRRRAVDLCVPANVPIGRQLVRVMPFTVSYRETGCDIVYRKLISLFLVGCHLSAGYDRHLRGSGDGVNA